MPIFRRIMLALLIVFAVPEAQAGEAADLFAKTARGSTKTVDHSAWERLLKTYVKPGPDGINRVDYLAFKAGGRDTLSAYLDALQKVDPATLDRPEQFAFLANLYNAKTIAIVLDHYPVRSIKDITLGGFFVSFTGGPWKAKVLKLRGVDLSLDDIEHGILRPVFKDPRVHYAVNCASLGCPNLNTDAFTGGKLNAQLDAAARGYVNHPRGVSVGTGGVRASSIYKWFGEDFGGSEQGVLQHLQRYAAGSLAAKLASANTISDYDYDWQLNDARR